MEKYPVQYSPSFWRFCTSRSRLCVILFGLCLSLLYFFVYFSDKCWYSSCIILYLQICQWENWNGHSVYQKKEVYLRLFYLLRSKRLLYKCTEINASNFLYSHFFFFASHGNVCTFLSLSFMKYNVLKTLCDDVIIFSGPVSGVVWGFVVFVSLIFRWIIADYCGCTRIYTVSMRWSHLPVQQCQLNAFRYDLIAWTSEDTQWHLNTVHQYN